MFEGESDQPGSVARSQSGEVGCGQEKAGVLEPQVAAFVHDCTKLASFSVSTTSAGRLPE